MRFLANENFPAPSIALLRKAGHDVLSIRETAPGITDVAVIGMAQATGRMILTFDKDYGEIIFKEGIEEPPTVVFFRYRGRDPQAAARQTLELLDRGTEPVDRFTGIEEDGIRQRIY